MPSVMQPGSGSKAMLWVGRITGGLAVLFLLFDAVVHLMKPAPVAAAFSQLGYPLDLSVRLGVLEIVCVALYVTPPTSVLGAILVTGYLGGAVASQLRVGHSFFEFVFPVILGLLFWGGLFFGDDRVRAIVPVPGLQMRGRHEEG